MDKNIFLNDKIIRTPSENLALNNYYSSLISSNTYDVVGRVYRHSNGIILGRNHDLGDVNLDECRKENYEISRRITGGLAVIVDPSVLCYSVFISKDIVVNQDIKDVYKRIVIPLAEKLGDDFVVTGNYYIRQRVNGEYVPVAGHAMNGSSKVIQLDGIVHQEPLDIEKTSRLLRLRELREYGGSKYVGFNNSVYDLRNKKTNIPFNETKLLLREKDILGKVKGLSYNGVTAEMFIDDFFDVLSEEYGHFELGEVGNLEEILKEESLFNILEAPGRNYKKARGHCFVDFADPEEKLE